MRTGFVLAFVTSVGCSGTPVGYTEYVGCWRTFQTKAPTCSLTSTSAAEILAGISARVDDACYRRVLADVEPCTAPLGDPWAEHWRCVDRCYAPFIDCYIEARELLRKCERQCEGRACRDACREPFAATGDACLPIARACVDGCKDKLPDEFPWPPPNP